MPILLADLLNAEHVTLDLCAATRDEALREIIATMSRSDESTDAEQLLREVRAREDAHTTYMGHGVAFPHARTDRLGQIILGIGRSLPGVPFGEKGELAHLIFLIGVPRRMVNDYLVCVGALARITADETTRAALRGVETASEFIEVLRVAALLVL